MIEALALTKRYAVSRRGVSRSARDDGAVTAAESVSFAVRPGEVVGLLGPNGAGKTTILRMLAGILTPTSGQARVAGIDAAVDPFALKRRLGFLSGDTALYQRLTPREVLRYFGRLHDLDDAELDGRIARLARELHMDDFVDRRCAGLSSGQRQKTNIARAFLHDPPALILDEPTTALDIVTGRFLLEAIARARQAGKAILFSTHTMGEAEALCDRVLFLWRGRIVDEGTVADVVARAGAPNLAEAFFARIDAQEAER